MKYNNFVIVIATIFTMIFASFSFLSYSQWTSVNSIICPQNTTRYKNTSFCSDGSNIYGSFPKKLIDLCTSKSVKGSSACINTYEMKVNFNNTDFNINLNRYSLKFFLTFANAAFCPNGTWNLNSNILCSDDLSYYGSFSSNFIVKCLNQLTPDACLRNKTLISDYNVIVKSNPIESPSNPNPLPIPPKRDPNQYNVDSMKQEVVRTIMPNSPDYFNNWEGYDYSGNFKQVYDKYHQDFNSNEISIAASKKWTTNPQYNPSSIDPRYNKEGSTYGGGQLMLKERFTRGHISFEAKLPNFKGAMPAIWLLNRDNPNYFAEIDCFETPGSESNNIYSVTHYGTKLGSIKTDYKLKKVSNISTTFNKFDIYKTSNKVVTLINGELLYERNLNETLSNGINGLDAPMEFVMNFNIGDKWAGSPINDSMLPYAMTIKDLKVEFYR
jgi:hypothetical protein